MPRVRVSRLVWSIVFVIFSRTAYSVDGPYEQPSSASSSYAQPWPPSTTCPSCGEPSHPAFSERILCGLGRCPVAKFDGKCNACHNPIKRGEHNIANVNGNWFHKACAVKIMHPRFYSTKEILQRALSYTTEFTFRSVMEQFITGQGHFILSCAPGAGKTTIASMIAQAVGADQTINIMFNKHNVLDAIAKGIYQSYTYHALSCMALMRYLHAEVSTYADLDDEGFTLNEDAYLLHAIMWTLLPPSTENSERDLVGTETRANVASGLYALFHRTVNTAVNLGMHRCLGLTVRACRPPGCNAYNSTERSVCPRCLQEFDFEPAIGEKGKTAWHKLFEEFNLFADLAEYWDAKRFTTAQVNEIQNAAANNDVYSWMDDYLLYLTMKVFAAANHWFWFGSLGEGLPARVHYINDYNKREYVKLGCLMFSQMPYFVVKLQLMLTPFAVSLIIVEEFQDLTPLFLEMVKLVHRNACACRRRNSPMPRIMALGDQKQAINYFQGAFTDALSALMLSFSMTMIVIKVTKRLSKMVVKACNALMTDSPEDFATSANELELLEASPDAIEGLWIDAGCTMRSIAWLIKDYTVFFFAKDQHGGAAMEDDAT